jgi:hypothetical protein
MTQNNQPANPYADKRFIGYVTMVSPLLTKVHFPSSTLLKNFFHADEGLHALVGRYVVIEGAGNGFLGKITEISLPEKERLDLTESKFDKEAFHPTGKIEILLCFDNYILKSKKGLNQLPPVSAKVFLCSNDFLASLLADFGKQKDVDKHTIQLATLPGDNEHNVEVSSQAIFGRHCAVVGTTGGGKSWTVAKLIEEVISNNAKAILIDATGEYLPFGKSEKVTYLNFNSASKVDGIYFDYQNLRESDIHALFRPTGQAQIPKLQEAMRSLRLVKILQEKTFKTENDQLVENVQNGFWSSTDQGITLIKKAGQPRRNIITAFKENISVYDLNCNFDIMALPFQIFNECVRDFTNGTGTNENNYGASDQNAQGFCQSLISRILVTINSQSFKTVFGFVEEVKPNNEFSAKVEEFLSSSSTKNVLIISVADVPTEHKLREILVNAIGRFLLEKSLKKEFRGLGRQSLLLFLDEAHLFLNNRIKDEYSIEVELDAFERIAKECRKFGLFLVLSTQMPRDIPRGVLSQMGTFIVHRLINQHDREAIEYACSEANKSALSFLPILSAGEAMLTGVDFPMPIILKIKAPNIKPDSETPNVFPLQIQPQ